MSRLSVVIVTYNCFELLKKCIDSVYKYNDIGDELEVIVVDNGSDGSYEKIKLLPEGKRIIAFSHENTGFGAGNNAGAAVSTGDVLLFLNPDTELIEPIFGFALEKFNNDQTLGCFGVQLLDNDRNAAPSGGFRLHMGIWKVQTYKLLNRLGVFLSKSMFTSGADLFIRRSSFFECGTFDENIFMYCEEADICNRLNSIGKKVAYFPEKHIIHNEGSTTARSFPQKYSAVLKAREYYCRKYEISFVREARKELRYCRAKALALKCLGKTEASSAYYEIVDILKNKISGQNEV